MVSLIVVLLADDFSRPVRAVLIPNVGFCQNVPKNGVVVVEPQSAFGDRSRKLHQFVDRPLNVGYHVGEVAGDFALLDFFERRLEVLVRHVVDDVAFRSLHALTTFQGRRRRSA